MSDARLNEISETESNIRNGNVTAEMADRLVGLYESEGLDAPAAKAYEIAATVYRTLGNVEKARALAKKAVGMGKLWLGPESQDFKRMARLEEELELERENRVR